MKVSILTSMFPKGFPPEFAERLQKLIAVRNRFVFVASEFEQDHKKTDGYCDFFLDMFGERGITFDTACVIDCRMDRETARHAAASADVLWLAGGDTQAQYGYLHVYGLIPVLRERDGITIGMSAGAINMGKTAVCTAACGHTKPAIYQALGLVDMSVEPHFNPEHISEELISLSKEYPIYGLCDGSAVICAGDEVTYTGDIYLISAGTVTRIPCQP